MSTPPAVVKEVVDRGIGQVTRRVEIYESDGNTLWAGDVSNRLIAGNVNLQYGDNERRSMDLTLKNDDNLLRSRPNGFWYDKVIKLYRGVTYQASMVTTRAVIIEHSGGTTGGVRLAALLKRFGVDAVYQSTFTSAADLLDYDIIISMTGTAATAKSADLKNLYNLGRNVVTISSANTATHVPHIASTASKSSTWGISQPAEGNDLTAGWTSEGITGTTTGQAVTGLAAGALQVARWTMTDSSTSITGSVAFNGIGGKWFDYHLPSLTGSGGSTQLYALLGNVLLWMKGGTGKTRWETQIGEFVIDGINGDAFPTGVKVNGRDYVKRCVTSKLENSSSFESSLSVKTLVTALAANAGVTKMRLTEMPETLGSTQSFERGTPRWDIMRAASHAAGYELFFDGEGYLTTRKYLDPSLGSPNHIFKTGEMGNLSTLTRSTNDSRIYNHVVVYGDPPSGEQRLPFVAEAKNTNPTSPTRISRIGDRFYSYASTFFTTQQQCQEYANRLLGLHALESYELNFSSINYPWMEVGEIARVLDPNAVASDPDKYLIDTASIPLALGPMSMTGKRVTMVG